MTNAEETAGLNIAGDRSFFPHFTADWAATVEENRVLLGHECVVLGEQTGPDAENAQSEDVTFVHRAQSGR